MFDIWGELVFLKIGGLSGRRVDLLVLSKWLCCVTYLVFDEYSLFVINSSLVLGKGLGVRRCPIWPSHWPVLWPWLVITYCIFLGHFIALKSSHLAVIWLDGTPWTRRATLGRARSGWMVSGWSWAITLFATLNSVVSINFQSSHFLCFLSRPTCDSVSSWCPSLHNLLCHKIPTFKSYMVDIISSCKLRQWSIYHFGSQELPPCTLSFLWWSQ